MVVNINNFCREANLIPIKVHWKKNKNLCQLDNIINKLIFKF